jgi:hypothetical protein
MDLHKSYIVLGLIIALALFCGIMANAQETSNTPITSTSAKTQPDSSFWTIVDRAVERVYLP